MNRRRESAGAPRIAIIGAGMGGLAAAALLAPLAAVTVYERGPTPGGKVRRLNVEGALIDSGPTVFTMRWVFDEIFAAAGQAFADYVDLRPLDVLARHFWRDGSRLDIYSDTEKTASAIRSFSSAADAENYVAFCKETERLYETLRAPFLRASAPSLGGLMARSNPTALLGVNPFSSLANALARRFRDPRLRQLFARYATYCGSSPYAAPATLMLIAHVERSGVWMPKGGVSAAADALVSLARKFGAEFCFDANVSGIDIRSGKVAGVEISESGKEPADIVIFNGDPEALASGLLGAAAARSVSLSRERTPSQSAITWSFVGDVAGDKLSAHNVFFSDDYEAEFNDVFEKRVAPASPTTYLFAPDRADPVHRADASERLFCLINAPSLRERTAFSQEEINQCSARVEEQMRQCGVSLALPKERSLTTTPGDFAAMFPGSGGALYGMASHGWRASFARPGARTRIPGLFLAGGGAHPGPGIPMAALSGRAAAREIMKDCGLTFPSSPAATPGGMSTR